MKIMGSLVYISKEKFNQLYWDDDFKPSEIAKMYGIHSTLMRGRFK